MEEMLIPVEILHPSGLTFRINLTPGEVERTKIDLDYGNEIGEKYFRLYQNGLVRPVNQSTTSSQEVAIDLEPETPAPRNWTAEDEESLIKLVSDRRALFDFRLPLKERSREITRNLWEEIIAEMNVDVTVEWICKKWKHIRDSFVRVRGNIKRKMASGSSAEEKLAADKLIKNHKNYELLLFLEDTLTTRRTTSNLPAENFDDDSHGSAHFADMDTPSTSRTPSRQAETDTPSTSRTNSRQDRSEVNRQDELFIKAIQSLPTNREFTPTQNFCLRLADGLERLPLTVKNQLEVEFLSRLTEMENKYIYNE